MTTKDVLTNEYLKNIKKWMFCPNCNNDESKMIINKDKTLWVCEDCGYRLSVEEFENDYVFWFCDECGTYLNAQKGFTDKDGIWVCMKCNCLNDVELDNIMGICKFCGEKLKNPDGTICSNCRSIQFSKWMERLNQAPEVLDSIYDVLDAVEEVENDIQKLKTHK